MSVCPIVLLNVSNGIYYYQCVDCDTNATSSMTSDQPLECGCDSSNSDCVSAGPPGPGIGPPGRMAAGPRPRAAKVKSAASRLSGVSASDGHLILDRVAKDGLASALPATYSWLFAKASIDSRFSGEDAYHVLEIGGRPRYVRVVHAVITPPSGLYHVTFREKVPRIHALPELELRVGQETDLPDGVKPRAMTTIPMTTPGRLYIQVKRSGARADPTVFHVLLKK
jgi:hypothetical protein